MKIPPLLQVRDLRCRFADGGEALHGLDFDLNDGEILGICGESGSGKSLTALSLMGLAPERAQVTGSVRFRGKELLGRSEAAWNALRGQALGMIFQNPGMALNPLMRVGKQVGESLLIHGTEPRAKAREAKVKAFLSRLDLADPERVMRAFPHELSGGMRQRICLALALIHHPALLLADEPTTALDPAVQRVIMELLKRFHERLELGILFISHDLRQVRRFCQRVLIFYGGQIVEALPASALHEQARHPYTKALLAAMPQKAKRGQLLPELPRIVPGRKAHEAGCPYALRCPLFESRCLENPQPMRPLSRKHQLRCWRRTEALG